MARRIKLNRQEQDIERALIKGEYLDVDGSEFEEVAKAVVARRRDALLNVHVNGQDLKGIKQLAKKLGVEYQAFISELLHRVAHTAAHN